MDKKILMVAVRAAIEAGAKIMDVYTDPDADFQIERKADNSPLTIADKKAHESISAILSETNIPILSEEGKKITYETRKEWNELWIVDPLDGTKEFIKKNGEFTVNIAYVKNGVPQAGVIYIPVMEVLYVGDCEYGAFKLDNVKSVSDENTLPELLAKATKLPVKEDRNDFVIVASRSHLSPETEDFIGKMKEQHKSIETISKGSSLKLCLIAEGKADIYPRFAPTMEWDTAAGHAIIRAAGKDVYHTDGNTPLIYNKEDLLNPWFIAK